MALNLPMVNNATSFSRGFNFDKNLMQEIMERQKFAELKKQHEAEMALRKDAAGRNAQLFPYRLQELKDKHAAAEFERNMMNQLLGIGGDENQNMPNQPKQPENSYPDLDKHFSGQGTLPVPSDTTQGARPKDGVTLEGQQWYNAKGEPVYAEEEKKSGPMNNPKFMQLMQNPMMRGWFKHHFGYDPLAPVAQTPEEKQAAQFDLFKQKEEYKHQQEEKMPAAVKTLHENIIHLSPKAVKAIQHLIDIPSPFEPWGLGGIKSGQKAAHHKAVLAAAENYAKAKGWPNTKSSIETAAEILERGKLETDFDYQNRLKGYQDELNEGVQESNKFLHPNKVINEPESDKNIIEYERVNGKLVPKKR